MAKTPRTPTPGFPTTVHLCGMQKLVKNFEIYQKHLRYTNLVGIQDFLYVGHSFFQAYDVGYWKEGLVLLDPANFVLNHVGRIDSSLFRFSRFAQISPKKDIKD
jgi:hypothetical protein